MTSGPDDQWGDDGRGSIRWQDPATATPRPPTVAEARQRDKAQKAREAAAQFAALQEQKARDRKAMGGKILMGSVAVVGVVGVVALGYQMLHKEEVAASCVKDGSNEVVPDSYCSSGHSGSGGTFIYLGSPYRYYYGGNSGGVGTVARGGTLELPKGTTAKTKSGTSISRGGFGSSSSYGKSSGS
ncbi:hypothetical protein [Mycolicibacterium alvei]|jgi:hypothetical protein|uniref:Uncharacterized protein n=1 Tax=Mycolicibacterium alvei TaxID=67081 RepID=A0A6N4USD9_9MYCO|nr:hypothetical protein [Mycolicibacterium alvei]MCV6999050.1 hypothetical protein [Mycolicibacterium alvei]BBX26352.1 hypothetical protein MALV_14770 [Mycolicibacterium alvei]